MEQKEHNLDEYHQINNELILEEHQYLSFYIKQDMFAIEVLKIREIIEYDKITKVPEMKSFVKGMTNIRGNIIPVIDLSDRLSLGESEITKRTSIVVVEHIHQHTKLEIGIIVDAINQVDDIMPVNIEEAPEFGAKVAKRFIQKMGKIGHEYIAVLKIDNILDVKELSEVTQVD
jgi:purine-binding chemotaxis protein CheW